MAKYVVLEMSEIVFYDPAAQVLKRVIQRAVQWCTGGRDVVRVKTVVGNVVVVRGWRINGCRGGVVQGP